MSNREIKFKAWHSGLKRIVPCLELTDDQLSLLANGKFANVHPTATRLTDIYDRDHITPLQFTGLHDEMGDEVYEDDIVECLYDGLFEQCVKRGVVRITPSGVMFEFGSVSVMYEEFESFTVIGNFHSDPALLETE